MILTMLLSCSPGGATFILEREVIPSMILLKISKMASFLQLWWEKSQVIQLYKFLITHIILGKETPRLKAAKLRVQRIQNVGIILQFIAGLGVKMVNIEAEGILITTLHQILVYSSLHINMPVRCRGW